MFIQILAMLFALQCMDEKNSMVPDMTGWPVIETRTHFTGPRGGVYHYSKSGKKVYEKHK